MICSLDETISAYGQHAGSIYIGEQPSRGPVYRWGDQFIQIIKWNMEILYKTSHSLCLQVSDEKIFFYFSQSDARIAYREPCLFVHSERYDKADRGPSKRFQMIRFLEIDQLETRITNGGHALLTNRDEMSTLYRIFHRCFLPIFGLLAKLFQMRRFKCEKLTGRRQMTDKKWLQNHTWSLARWGKNDVTHP